MTESIELNCTVNANDDSTTNDELIIIHRNTKIDPKCLILMNILLVLL